MLFAQSEDPTWYNDQDFDGYFISKVKQPNSPGAGWAVLGQVVVDQITNQNKEYIPIKSGDCAPQDATKWQSVTLYLDVDGDGFFGTAQSVCVGMAIPAGFSQTKNDCNDGNASKWKYEILYRDNDGDGFFGTPENKCIGNDIPNGFRAVSNDCDDNNPLIGSGIKWFRPCPCYGPGCATGGRDTLSLNCDDLSYLGLIRYNDGPCTSKRKHVGSTIQSINGFSISPNPATTEIRITAGDAIAERVQITVTDQYGRVVKAIQVPQLYRAQVMTVNTNSLSSGYYYVTMKYGVKIETKKVAIKL